MKKWINFFSNQTGSIGINLHLLYYIERPKIKKEGVEIPCSSRSVFFRKLWFISYGKYFGNKGKFCQQQNDSPTHIALKSSKKCTFWDIALFSVYCLPVDLRAGSSKSELAKISELTNKWIKNSKNVLLIKLFCFYSDFDETWWSCSK